MRGVIDEYVQLSQVRPRATNLTIDLVGITRLNSVGVREFSNFMQRLSDCKVRVVNCSPAIVSQASLVAGFFGEAVVESFLVPLYCENCDSELNHLVQADTYRDSGLPDQECDGCREPIAFDAENHIEEFYFSFLRGESENA